MKIAAFILWISSGLLIWGCESIPKADQEYLDVIIPSIEIERDDLRIQKGSEGLINMDGKLFSGYLLSFHENDSLASRQSYFYGKLHGISALYFPNGKLKERRSYFHGEKHGEHIGFHANGKQSFSYQFSLGFNEGNHKEWYESGDLYADMNYVQGKEFGTQRIWRTDGKLRANYIVRENGRRYGLQGIKRCTKLDGESQTIDPYNEEDN